MSRAANPAVVGGFVVGAIALVVVGILVFGSGAVLREKVQVVAFFAGNVRGLQEGSAVEFRGVRVGTVKQIQVSLDVDTRELMIPVYMELATRSLQLTGTAEQSRSTTDAEVVLDRLVAQGLRARLDMKSFVTGQLTVGLDMLPGSAVRRTGAIADVYELPTVPSTLDRVAALLQDLPLQDIAAKFISALDSASRLLSGDELAQILRETAAGAADARQFLGELRSKTGPTIDAARATLEQSREAIQTTSARANDTLDAYSRLAQDTARELDALSDKASRTMGELAAIGGALDARVVPIAKSAVASLDEARGAFANARELLAEDSRTRYNLDKALEELTAAARSLRLMADYLEQNPDALLKGKR